MTYSRKIAALFAASGLMIGAAAPAMAQQSGTGAPATTTQPPAMGSQGQAADYSDDKLDAVTEAMVEVQKVRGDFVERIQGTQDEQERQQLVNDASEEMMRAVEESDGVSVAEYNEILAAASANPELARDLESRLQDGME